MIIAKVVGGLGNQMFIYAFSRRLAIGNRDDLLLDASYYDTYVDHWTNVRKVLRETKHNILGRIRGYTPTKPRALLLDRFNIEARVMSRKELGAARSRLGKGITHLKERDFQFDPEALGAKGDLFVEGFWQTPLYFESVADTIRKDFTLKSGLSPEAQRVHRMMETCESVSLHIRRTDFQIGNSFGALGLDYYEKAMGQVEDRIPDPHYFVFTDEPRWVEENLKGKGRAMTVVSGGGIPDYEELVLMSKCRHNITANSTYSWWGAWLNQNEGKIVTTPAVWFREERLNVKSRIPSSWIRI